MDNVLKLIHSLNIYDDEPVVLACSYGPDSMCLLDILQKMNLNIVVAHVNHNLREESKEEYQKLEEYCYKNNLIFEGYIIEEKTTNNIEEFYRHKRYEFLKNIVIKYHSTYLFTAHHGDDLIETILMRLNRGSSFRGYAGFNKITKTKDYILVRPLIYLTKEEILSYVKDNNIPYAIDQSNLSLKYTRNRYRMNILPVLKDINPTSHQKFLKFSEMINEYNDYIDNEVLNYKSKLYINNHLDLNEFNILPNLIKKNLLKSILLDIYQDNISLVYDKHIELIFDLINNNLKNSYINLPMNIIISKYYNILEFNSSIDNIDYDYILDKELIINDNIIKIIDSTDIIKSNYLIRLDSKDIKLPLHIRNRLIGDKIELKNGTKKVGEILSENKIPQNIRNMIPIMCDDNGKILWILGIKKSKFDKQVNDYCDIIVKYIKKERYNEE